MCIQSIVSIIYFLKGKGETTSDKSSDSEVLPSFFFFILNLLSTILSLVDMVLFLFCYSQMAAVPDHSELH